MLPSNGRSGGILLGVKTVDSEVCGVEFGEHFVLAQIRSRVNALIWDLIVVYGPAQYAGKENFLRELAQVCSRINNPTCLGGDFNLIRRADEKSNEGECDKWSFLFNAVIESYNLVDLPLVNRKFTWCNDHENPIYRKLDRVLVTTSWLEAFPLVHLSALSRERSDHTPLVLDTGSDCPKSTCFKFELWWLLRPELSLIVKEVWDLPAGNRSAAEEWVWRLAVLRKKLRGWNRNIASENKKMREELLANLDTLDKLAEAGGASTSVRPFQLELKKQYNILAKEDEIKWWQRAKSQDLKLGDNNTKNFMNRASGRRRENKIFQLCDRDEVIQGDQNLLAHATEFYKSLFGHSEVSQIRMDLPFPHQISVEDNFSITRDFSLEDIKRIVFSLDHNKAPRPDGFLGDFYQFF